MKNGRLEWLGKCIAKPSGWASGFSVGRCSTHWHIGQNAVATHSCPVQMCANNILTGQICFRRNKSLLRRRRCHPSLSTILGRALPADSSLHGEPVPHIKNSFEYSFLIGTRICMSSISSISGSSFPAVERRLPPTARCNWVARSLAKLHNSHASALSNCKY